MFAECPPDRPPQFTSNADALILNFLASHLKFKSLSPEEQEGPAPLYSAAIAGPERKIGGDGKTRKNSRKPKPNTASSPFYLKSSTGAG